MGRIVAFLSYMSRDKTELGSWRFLDDAGRIMAWPAELTERERKAVTTVKVYLVNTTQFHVYFMETPPRSSRLSKRQLVSVMRALRSATCQIGTKVVLRQIKVKSEKLQRSVTPEILRRCIAKCRGWIPKLLLSCSQKKHDVGLRHLLFGFFGLYLISLYGHRAGVMTNLTTEEVLEAASGAVSSSPGVVLNVFLTHEELGWIQRWMEIRARLRPQCDLVFFNTNHQHVNTITAFARNAWAAMLLPGRPSLTDIRTAVATMVSYPGKQHNRHPTPACLPACLPACPPSDSLPPSLSLSLSPHSAGTPTPVMSGRRWPGSCATTPARPTDSMRCSWMSARWRR
ncbi:uncharacterized protein LOC116716452 isoform X2 [Xiphophorus hellerii]|uniref:uncharacterized protein LOC116716452 isoform X2 n=1 Tax=Xiphophorus hellerii TaxID=8084 RepID=UPI0013B46C67|nr:uncharacterized protein LOC116716452 isoform X2 [Xiphophorus hellerii]